MILEIFLLILGLVLVIKGADWLVEGATAIAKKYKVSDLAIGLTIVAFGTSVPELVVNTYASFQDHDGIVFGNVIGSNNFNLFIILGIAGLIAPLTVQTSTVWKEIPLSFLAVVILYVLANDFTGQNTGILTRVDGFILLALFLLFLFYVYKQLKTDPSEPITVAKDYTSLKVWGFIILGLIALILGGRLVVTNASEIATILGMSEKVIGLTIVAAGTSLPELATSVLAAIKKKNDIAVGNIIGSNIFNIFLILAVSSLTSPISYDDVFNIDLYILAGGTAFLFLAMFTGQLKKLERWQAGVLLVSYLGYMTYLVGKAI